MAGGKEEVPQAKAPGLFLEVLNQLGVGVPSRVALAELGVDDGVGTVEEENLVSWAAC